MSGSRSLPNPVSETVTIAVGFSIERVVSVGARVD
jgi:hypothetical protein